MLQVAVVISATIDDLTSRRLAEASIYPQNPACHFIVTDNAIMARAGKYTKPGRWVSRRLCGASMTDGVEVTGAVFHVLIAASGRTPVFIGKPFQPMVDALLS